MAGEPVRRISPTTFRIARRGTSREINRQIALNLIRSKQPVSRADLARLMGVRRGAVSRLIDELLEAGLVFEGAKGESPRGRKPMHLHVETRRRCVAAVDVSASHTAFVITDVLGRPLLEVAEFPTRRRPSQLVKDVADALARALEDHPELGECIGIGVSVSGLVDAGGQIRFSPTLGWREVELLQLLEVATKLPVVVENSMKACMLGQVWSVRGDTPVDGPVAFVNVSDGVGVGIAVDGKLLRGAHNAAGELGHVPLNIYGPRCACGQQGCWEAYVSKRAVIARYRGTDPSWPASAETGSVTLEHIMARARRERGTRSRRSARPPSSSAAASRRSSRRWIPGGSTSGGRSPRCGTSSCPPSRRTFATTRSFARQARRRSSPSPSGRHPRLRGAAALIGTPAFAATDVS